MTEQEAAKMPCIGPHPELTGRRMKASGAGSEIFVCSGSACGMAWRWVLQPAEYTVRTGWDEGKQAPTEITRRVIGEGYCGLAGKP